MSVVDRRRGYFRRCRYGLLMATLSAVTGASIAVPAGAQPAIASSGSSQSATPGGTAQIALPGPVAPSHSTIDITPAAPADGSFSLQSPVTGVAPGAQTAPVGSPVATSFDEFSRNVHGYASAGVGNHDGHEFQAGVLVPLIPGKLELEAGAGTSQQGGLTSFRPGAKPGTLRGTSYYAALHAHPSDDVDITVGFSHSDLYSGGANGGRGPVPLFR